jgi:hypothetical protein
VDPSQSLDKVKKANSTNFLQIVGFTFSGAGVLLGYTDHWGVSILLALIGVGLYRLGSSKLAVWGSRSKKPEFACIYDTILWLQSSTDMKPFPIVQFSADTDMSTQGWVSLSSTDRPEIVITQLTAEEYRNTINGTDAYLQLERRVNNVLDRTDLRCSWLVRVEQPEQSNQGTSFTVFGSGQLPKKLLYRDILSTDSVAEVVGQVTLAEFERNGGNVKLLK